MREQVGSHRCITDMASGDLDGRDFHRLLVDSEMDLRKIRRWGRHARVLLAFALEGSAVDQRLQRPLGPM